MESHLVEWAAANMKAPRPALVLASPSPVEAPRWAGGGPPVMEPAMRISQNLQMGR